MSLQLQQQQNSREMEKISGCGIDNMTKDQAKPFSIRQFVSAAREKGLAQNWPFPEKFMKLCINKGLTNILPPLEAPCLSKSPEELAVYSPMGKQSNINMIRYRDVKKLEHTSVLEETVEEKISQICLRVERLSLSNDHKQRVKRRRDVAVSPLSRRKIRAPVTAPDFNKDTAENNFRGRKRKLRIKMKSLAEIFAVAKHCVLDSNLDRVYVSVHEGDFAKEEEEEGVFCATHDRFNNESDEYGFTEDLYRKKHRRCKGKASCDSGQRSKRRHFGCKDGNRESKYLKRNLISFCNAADVQICNGGGTLT